MQIIDVAAFKYLCGATLQLAQARKELQVQSSEAEQAQTVLRQQKDEMEEWAADRYVCTNAHPQCAHVS